MRSFDRFTTLIYRHEMFFLPIEKSTEVDFIQFDDLVDRNYQDDQETQDDQNEVDNQECRSKETRQKNVCIHPRTDPLPNKCVSMWVKWWSITLGAGSSIETFDGSNIEIITSPFSNQEKMFYSWRENPLLSRNGEWGLLLLLLSSLIFQLNKWDFKIRSAIQFGNYHTSKQRLLTLLIVTCLKYRQITSNSVTQRRLKTQSMLWRSLQRLELAQSS